MTEGAGVTTSQQQDPATVTDQLAAIEKRVERIQFFTAWMLTLLVLGTVAGVIVGIVIANGVNELVSGGFGF